MQFPVSIVCYPQPVWFFFSFQEHFQAMIRFKGTVLFFRSGLNVVHIHSQGSTDGYVPHVMSSLLCVFDVLICICEYINETCTSKTHISIPACIN